jgi:hypothetical protein
MAGTTNFVQHNPSAANQEPDSTFDSDSLTTGGIGEDAIMPSAWMNKRWYQDSTFIFAFATMLAAKGYSTSDANPSTLAAVLANVLTNADILPAQIPVTFSPTPTFDCSKANGFSIVLAGNVTSSTVENLSVGQIVTFFIVSSSPGVFTFAWPSNVVDPPNVQTESEGNLLTWQCVSDGTSLYPLSTFMNTLQIQIGEAAAAAAAAQSTANTANTNALDALTDIADLEVTATFSGSPTGGRALNTTYTNTDSGPRLVFGYANTSGSSVGRLTANIGPSAPSTTIWANENTASVSGAPVGFCFVVPAGYQYTLQSSGDITGLGAWTETLLGV